MFRNFVLVIILLYSMGCSLDYPMETIQEEGEEPPMTKDEIYDEAFKERINKSSVYSHEDFETLVSVVDIQLYLASNFTYVSEGSGLDYWQTPEETMAIQTGDCEDFVILFMNIYYFVFEEESSFVLTYKGVRDIEEGGTINHALVETPNGDIYEARILGKRTTATIGYSYSFSEFFNF